MSTVSLPIDRPFAATTRQT